MPLHLQHALRMTRCLSGLPPPPHTTTTPLNSNCCFVILLCVSHDMLSTAQSHSSAYMQPLSTCWPGRLHATPHAAGGQGYMPS